MTTATKVKERGILFSGEMVRAILDGRKTQTRRPVKKQPPAGWNRTGWYHMPIMGWTNEPEPAGNWHTVKCPYGRPGDRLWVRETAKLRSIGPDENQIDLAYRATGSVSDPLFPLSPKPYSLFKWTPSIHMPRWASRITLEITNVRVERIRSIPAPDFYREGYNDGANFKNVKAFEASWNATYPGSWDRNDWVWVIDFKKI